MRSNSNLCVIWVWLWNVPRIDRFVNGGICQLSINNRKEGIEEFKSDLTDMVWSNLPLTIEFNIAKGGFR